MPRAVTTAKLYEDADVKLTRDSDGRFRLDVRKPRYALYQFYAVGEND